jgi:hypothetical protein
LDLVNIGNSTVPVLATVTGRGAPPELSSSPEPSGGFFGPRDDMIDHLSSDTNCWDRPSALLPINRRLDHL